MSKTIPTTISGLTLEGYRLQAGRDVLASGPENMAETLHYLYARKGSRCQGLVFAEPWTTSSASYTQTNSNATNADKSLSDWEGSIRFARPIYGTSTAGKAYELTLCAVMKNLDLRLTLERIDASLTDSVTTTTLVLTNTNSTDSENISGAKEYANAAVYEGGSTSNDPAIFRLYLEGKSKDGTNPGYLWMVAPIETRIVAANLPLEP